MTLSLPCVSLSNASAGIPDSHDEEYGEIGLRAFRETIILWLGRSPHVVGAVVAACVVSQVRHVSWRRSNKTESVSRTRYLSLQLLFSTVLQLLVATALGNHPPSGGFQFICLRFDEYYSTVY